MKIKKCGICGREGEDYSYNSKNDMILCHKHYQQFIRFGKFLDNNRRTVNDLNNFIIKDDYAEIELYDINGNIIDYAKIDLEDVEICKNYKWRIVYKRNKRYVVNNKREYLARYLIGLDKLTTKDEIDHIDGESLNNRRYNLKKFSKKSPKSLA